jgi:hypothetical protein
MDTLSITIKVIALLALAACSAGGCPNSGEVHLMSTENSSQDEITIIRQYVATQKGWNPSDYKVERIRQENHYIVYMVTYLPDATILYPGGGKSFEAYYDPATRKVVKEMRFQ